MSETGEGLRFSELRTAPFLLVSRFMRHGLWRTVAAPCSVAVPLISGPVIVAGGVQYRERCLCVRAAALLGPCSDECFVAQQKTIRD